MSYHSLRLKKFIEFFACNLFLLNKKLSTGIKYTSVLLDNLSRFLVAVINYVLYFLINDGCTEINERKCK